VQWSRANSDMSPVPYAAGEDYTNLMDNAVLREGFSLLVAEVTYEHDSDLTGFVLGDSINYEERRIRTPRRSRVVQLCDRDADGEYDNCI